MTVTQTYDLYSQDFSRHAYEIFSHIRRERPILQQTGIDGRTPIWFVSRYEDVEALLKDDRHFTVDFRKVLGSDQTHFMRSEDRMADMINNHLLTRDGEDHRRLRALVSKAFNPQRISAMRPRIQAIADQLLDRVQAQGAMDLVDILCLPPSHHRHRRAAGHPG